MTPLLPPETVAEVRDRCLCLAAQRVARALARRFDRALAPVRLTNRQFSLMMALNRDEPPRISDLAAFLAMDRTTLTAALKPLERRGLVEARADRRDRRNRRLSLTESGTDLLGSAVPLWRAAHDTLDAGLPEAAANGLRVALAALANPEERTEDSSDR
jgi:DNA-binding MarR family transcriptional regulator